MNNVKNLWQENKKLVILYGLGGFFILLILIFVIIILMNVLRTYKYNDVEQIMVEKTEKYLLFLLWRIKLILLSFLYQTKYKILQRTYFVVVLSFLFLLIILLREKLLKIFNNCIDNYKIW